MEYNNLAIIIPAYKQEFLSNTLDSLTYQTNKNFVVYIGDDASPYDIKSIVDKFNDKLNIHYYRFNNNLGASSLTKQWERCINLCAEKWIWLFSDDDIANPDCVDVFLKRKDKKSKFFKFNTQIINSTNKHILKKYDEKNISSNKIESSTFIKRRLNCENFRSFAVEYIFHIDLFNEVGFVDFPLAWASDDATWFNYSLLNGGYISVLDAFVRWRLSDKNISSSVSNVDVNNKKITASILYVKWLINICLEKKISLNQNQILKWLSIQIASLRYPINYMKFKEIIASAGIVVGTLDKIKNYGVIKFFHIRNNINL